MLRPCGVRIAGGTDGVSKAGTLCRDHAVEGGAFFFCGLCDEGAREGGKNSADRLIEIDSECPSSSEACRIFLPSGGGARQQGAGWGGRGGGVGPPGFGLLHVHRGSRFERPDWWEGGGSQCGRGEWGAGEGGGGGVAVEGGRPVLPAGGTCLLSRTCQNAPPPGVRQ